MNLRIQKYILLIGDIVLLYGALALTLFVRAWGQWDAEMFTSHLMPFSVLFAGWIVLFYVTDLYNLALPPNPKFVSRFGVILGVAFTIGIIYFYLIPFSDIAPKTNLLIHTAFFGGMSVLWRSFFFSKALRKSSWRIGLVGDGQEVAELQQLIESHKHVGIGCVPLKSVEHLPFHIEKNRLHVVVLSQQVLSDISLTQKLYNCLPLGVTFVDYARAYELFAKRIPLSAIDQTWFLKNIQERDTSFYLHMKRLFDVVAALIILFLTLPLWPIIILAVKLGDGGPVLYTQTRVGKGGKPFSIIKFRTMRIDAEKNGPRWASKNDSRVTKTGAILRATHLDELPQMFNILKGDISLVGPRPERPEFVSKLEQEIDHYHVRHFIKPGFTGWAQVYFRYARSVMDSREKFEYDLYYIKNRSLVLDLLIALKTARLVIGDKSG